MNLYIFNLHYLLHIGNPNNNITKMNTMLTYYINQYRLNIYYSITISGFYP